MTIRHLRIFIAVHDKQSMTAAANQLYMTQPSISQAIKELEAYYGVILFERLSHKLYITESGKTLYQYASHIIKLFDELEDGVKETSSHKKLTIGANYTAGSTLIERYIRQFNVIFPDSEIRVRINKASILTEMLRSNELDLALMEENDLPDLKQEIFYDDRIVIVADPEHPLAKKKKIAAADLVNERLLLREKGAGVRNLFESKMNHLGLSIQPYWESTSTTALIHAANNRLGIAVLPFQLVLEQIASGSLKELKIEGMDLSRKLAIFYHKNKFLTSAIKEFIRICHTPSE
ncbi:LysR family transcriptional regulator [Ethanoligenens sp.]|uniref:LysR family transcriptional regulator n=1 Tax=Ethanoligenens sp. TaxID=2099655 RepID=UPI0039E7688D